MRMLLGITVAALVSGAAVAAGGATPARTTPTISVTSHSIQGRHFYRRERVRLTFLFQIREARQVRTTASGSFDTPLPAAYDPCTEALTISAVGVQGDTARLKLPQRACAPPQ